MGYAENGARHVPTSQTQEFAQPFTPRHPRRTKGKKDYSQFIRYVTSRAFFHRAQSLTQPFTERLDQSGASL